VIVGILAFIRTCAGLIARGAALAVRTSGRIATTTLHAARQGAGSLIRSLPPSLQRVVPRIFGYRQLPQITFGATQRITAGHMLKTVLVKTKKTVLIIGGFSGFGYLVDDIAKATKPTVPIMTDEEMADIITSRVFQQLAEQELERSLDAANKQRDKFVADRRKKKDEEDAADEARWQEARKVMLDCKTKPSKSFPFL
jgi:hypothetical protein